MYYRSNFDYEQKLECGDFSRKKPFSNLAYNYEFEYLFFFLQINGVLNTPIKYSAEYLDSIQKMTGVSPKINNIPQVDYSFWWGQMNNPEKEKLLNDKKFFWEFCEKEKIPYPKTIINFKNLNEIQSRELILRPRFGMSGIKSQVLKREELKELPNGLIASSYYSNRQDFGLLLQKSGSTIYYENEISKKFHYKGSTFFPENYNKNEEEVLSKYISKLKMINQGEGDNLQFDGFFTQNEFFFNELNFRETMASIVGEFVRKKYTNNLVKLKVLPFNEYMKIQASRNLVKITPDAKVYSYRFGLVLEIQD